MRNNYPVDLPIDRDAKALARCPCGAIGQHIVGKDVLCMKCMEKWVAKARATPPKSRSVARRPFRSSSDDGGDDPYIA